MGERIQTKESIYLNKFYHMIFNFIQKFNHLNQNLKTSFCKKNSFTKKEARFQLVQQYIKLVK